MRQVWEKVFKESGVVSDIKIKMISLYKFIKYSPIAMQIYATDIGFPNYYANFLTYLILFCICSQLIVFS